MKNKKITRAVVLDRLSEHAEISKAMYSRSKIDFLKTSSCAQVFAIEMLAMSFGFEELAEDLEKWRDETLHTVSGK